MESKWRPEIPDHPSITVLLDQLRHGETRRIEAKRGTEVGKATMPTISAFSNEPQMDGGYLLFGVERVAERVLFDEDAAPYSIVGVRNPEKIQDDLATCCSNMMTPAIRPLVWREELHWKMVVAAFVPEADATAKPVYITAKGMQDGAFRRIGSTDQRFSQQDLRSFLLGSRGKGIDSLPVQGCGLADIEGAALRNFRRLLQRTRPHSPLVNSDDETLLVHLGAAVPKQGSLELVLTGAGIIAFGRSSSIRREFPLARIDYVRVIGDPRRDSSGDEQLVLDTTESLLQTVEFVVSKVLEDVESRQILRSGSLVREERPILPDIVVREAIVNAVMHRAYDIHAPVVIRRSGQLLEITNPGYSLSRPDDLGRPQSTIARNGALALILHDCGLAENRGTGIARMIREMKGAGLSPPEFVNDPVANRFQVRLWLHNLLTEADLQWLSGLGEVSEDDHMAQLLIQIRNDGRIDNSGVRGLLRIGDSVRAGRYLTRLRDLGWLLQQGAGNLTFYEPAGVLRDAVMEWGALYHRIAIAPPSQGTKPPSQGTKPPRQGAEPSRQGFEPPRQELLDHSKSENESEEERSSTRLQLSPKTRAALGALGKRAKDRESVKQAVLMACREMPLTLSQLAVLLSRDEKHIQDAYVRPLLKEGKLKFVYPETPGHPKQAYRVDEYPHEFER